MACAMKMVGNPMRWRLPTIQELTTLVDPTVSSLPPGHPFSSLGLPQTTRYWSATSSASFSTSAWAINLEPMVPKIVQKGVVIENSIEHLAWCVRGGSGVEAQ